MTERESKTRTTRAVSQTKAAPTGWRRLTTPYDPLTSLALTMPVFVVYHLGLLLTDLRNGADLVTAAMVSVLERSVPGYIALTLAIAACVVFAGVRMRSRHHLEPKLLVPVIGESAVWSVVLLLCVGWLTARVLGAAWFDAEGWLTDGAWFGAGTPLQIGPRALGPLERVVMACGAGFHEEVVFRVGLFGGGAWALERWGKLSSTHAALAAALMSSLLFSAVHYVGSLGDAFTLSSFTFRFFMGLAFAALYKLRGFAVAVYTHTLYDLMVFFVLPG